MALEQSDPTPALQPRHRLSWLGLPLLMSAGVTAYVTSPDLRLVGALHSPTTTHLDQAELLRLVRNGRTAEAFAEAFEHGDELFETRFNTLDGVGAHVGDGQRFTRVPRADRTGPGEWYQHHPERVTGPNGSACNECHNQPADDGAGPAAGNVHRDPRRRGILGQFIQRSAPHTFAAGALQVLAEEMTTELHALRARARADALRTQAPVAVRLVAKGIDFGSLRAVPGQGNQVSIDAARVSGLDRDLIVRPYQWKGSVASLRDFNRGAAHNELGMQAVELVGHQDGDSDGVIDEMSIGDQTALAVYLAAQPRPVTQLELNALGLLTPPLTTTQIAAISRGEAAFTRLGCAACHQPTLLIDRPIYAEPSAHPAYRDERFPGGQAPIAEGVDPAYPVAFDLTRDQPDNRVMVNGRQVLLGSFPADARGRAVVNLYGDLRRHRMGDALAESIDEVGTGADTFLTENLWGVGSTAPYLHDGRATTLTEAILAHGGEAAGARRAFTSAQLGEQRDLIAFLENLVLFKIPE